MGMNMEAVECKGSEDFETGLERELENYRNRCIELEERSKKAEERCAALELEVQNKKIEFELLEGSFGALAVEKLALENELGDLKKRNDELEVEILRIENGNKVVSEEQKGMGRKVDFTEQKDDEDKVIQLMIENEILDCEKKKAESEAEVWKVRLKELGLKDGLDVAFNTSHLQTGNKMVDTDEIIHAATGAISACNQSVKGIGDLQASGTPPIDTPYKQSTHVKAGKRGILSGNELEYGSRVRKQLAFGEGSPNKRMAPSTPCGARPASVGVIDISDSDVEPDSTIHHIPLLEIQGHKMVSASTGCASEGTLRRNEFASNNNLKRLLLDRSDEEDMGDYGESFPFTSTIKRKRASNIVTSDSESDDDNVPICKLMTKHLPELKTDSDLNSCSVTGIVSGDKVRVSVSRRHLMTLRNCEVKNGPERSSPTPSNLTTSETKYFTSIPTNEDVEVDEMVDDGSDSEGESLGGFIVDSSESDASYSDDASYSNDASGESENVSEGNLDFGGIISSIRRNRNPNSKWEFEADMLAAFGKDPELCMKAVCALYRQQTSEEKISKGTIYSNQRGFSQCDALRGTTLAEFLTDGDPKGDLQKSVEELQEYNHKGLELCRTLATHYSKQLFAIYQNKEDPFFLPQ